MSRTNRKSRVSSVVPTSAKRSSQVSHNTNRHIMDALTIADYFIWKSQQEDKPVTNKKLQKLLYYAQAWSLALNNKKIFKEDIEAWVHGPAVREVYGTYKKYGFSYIKKEITESAIKDITNQDRRLLDEIWSVYGKYDADYLEMLSHSEDPWQEARAGLDADAGSSNVIDPDLMKTFYSAKLAKARA